MHAPRSRDADLLAPETASAARRGACAHPPAAPCLGRPTREVLDVDGESRVGGGKPAAAAGVRRGRRRARGAGRDVRRVRLERSGALRRGRDAARAGDAVRRRQAWAPRGRRAVRAAGRAYLRVGADLLPLRPARAPGAARLLRRLGARARRAGGGRPGDRRCATSCTPRISALRSPRCSTRRRQGAVNLASGDARPIRSLVEALAEAAGRPDLLRIGARPGNPSEPASITAAVDRLRDEVGWRPARTLEQRAAETVAWWRASAGARAG